MCCCSSLCAAFLGTISPIGRAFRLCRSVQPVVEVNVRKESRGSEVYIRLVVATEILNRGLVGWLIRTVFLAIALLPPRDLLSFVRFP